MERQNLSIAGKKKTSPFWIVAMVFAVIWLVIAGGPFVYQIFTTFKTQGELTSGSLFELPHRIQFENYAEVLKGGFYLYFINSIIVLAVSLTVLLLLSAFAAYPLSRMEFKLNRPIFGIIVAAMSIPVHITLIPVFIMTKNLGIYDNLFALIGPNVAFNLPISVFILTTFMGSISREMEEAADIDGCGKFSTFFRIIFPLTQPGLATLAIYNGVVIWNEFVFAMTLSPNNRTLPLGVWQFTGQYSLNIPMVMTLLVLSSLPVILLYIFGQEKMVKGMMAGAVKG
jgi:raffinose/stachyose/melibiose transport system permease protein